MTYHLGLPLKISSTQIMMSDYVIFAETHSSITFELCFVEVKRKENHYKGHYESDLIKLEKKNANWHQLKLVFSLKLRHGLTKFWADANNW